MAVFDRQAAKNGLGFPPGLALYIKLVLLLTVLPFLFVAELAYVGNSALQARLWSPASDRFGDFWHYRVLLDYLHKPEFFLSRDRFAYPAPCAILYRWLYHLGSHPHVSYNLILWSVEGISALLLLRGLLRAGLHPSRAVGLILLMAATSYPWYFLYDRGNIELFVYVLIAGGVWAWATGHDTLAAALWGTAGALKIYPLLMLAMFLGRGRWRFFATGVAVFLAVLLGSFWWVGPNIKLAASGTMWGIRGFVGTYGAHTRFNELAMDHSILGGIKEILSLPGLHKGDEQITLSHIYEALVLLAGPPAFLRWRRSTTPTNQVCLLLTLIMALPPVSYDYTLIYAYIVFGFIACAAIAAWRQGTTLPGARTYFTCFALLATTETWVNLLGFEPNGLIKSVALITIMVTLIRYPLGQTVASRSSQTVPLSSMPDLLHQA